MPRSLAVLVAGWITQAEKYPAITDVINALSIFFVSGKDKAKVDGAIKYLTGIQDRQAASSSDMEKNISDLLGAIGSLPEIADPGISDLLMDKMLTFWESRWYLDAELGNEGLLHYTL